MNKNKFSPPPKNPYQKFPEVPSFDNEKDDEDNTPQPQQNNQNKQQPKQNSQNKQPNFNQTPQYPLNNQKSKPQQNNQQKNTQSQRRGYTNEYVPQQTYGSYSPPIDHIYDSQKVAKSVLSSLQFDDVPTAIENLYTCLRLLTGVDHKELMNERN